MSEEINFTDKYLCLIDIHNARRHFTKNSLYTIDHKYYHESNISSVSLIDDNKDKPSMLISEFNRNFISLKEHRKQKLKKINGSK
jgi:hypothetical protein